MAVNGMFDVVIPIYKITPELLNRCLESVSNQDFFDYEVYVVDGTPLDWSHTAECQNLVAHYNFNYCRQIGTGVSQARNQGVSEGNNPYIAFLDGDDWWYPEHLHELSLLIDRCPIANNYVMWWNPMDTIIVMETTKNKFESHKYCNYFADHAEWPASAHGIWIMRNAVFPSSVAVARSRFLEVGGFPEDLYAGEDTTCWVLMLGDNRQTNQVFLTAQSDFVGAFHDLQGDVHGGVKGFFNKGQNPCQDLWGSQAEEKFQQNLMAREKYISLNPEVIPKGVTEEQWTQLCGSTNIFGYSGIVYDN